MWPARRSLSAARSGASGQCSETPRPFAAFTSRWAMARGCTASGQSATRSGRADGQVSANGISGDRPMAPKICIARSATASIIEISLRAALAPISSIIHAAFRTGRRGCSISRRNLAIASCAPL
jgi:hypothetical protein